MAGEKKVANLTYARALYRTPDQAIFRRVESRRWTEITMLVVFIGLISLLFIPTDSKPPPIVFLGLMALLALRAAIAILQLTMTPNNIITLDKTTHTIQLNQESLGTASAIFLRRNPIPLDLSHNYLIGLVLSDNRELSLGAFSKRYAYYHAVDIVNVVAYYLSDTEPLDIDPSWEEHWRLINNRMVFFYRLDIHRIELR